MVEALELRVPLVPTKENPADFLTKPLDKGLFFAHRDTFMNVRGAGANSTSQACALFPFCARVGRPDAGLGGALGVERVYMHMYNWVSTAAQI